MTGEFSPSPHPMESFITITAMITVGEDVLSKEFFSHCQTFNFRIGTEPQGFPIMLEVRPSLLPHSAPFESA
jgi:hypothetical protein